MSHELLQDIESFLTELDRVQDGLIALFAIKSRALHDFQAETLVRVAAQEALLARELTTLLERRRALLERARAAGLPDESLQSVAGAIGTGDQARVLERIGQAKGRSTRLRHESWTHWIISHRCYNHYTELLDLIAYHGKRAPTYAGRFQAAGGATGGAVLDASI